jgi:predicted NBD/HSP70 family sugar kinase
MATGDISARRARTRQTVLAALTADGSATRAALSAATGLSRSAISECIADLVADGTVVEEPAAGPGGRGRPATAVRLSRPDGVVLGVDLGHAHVTVAVATTGGDLLVERSADLDVDHRPHPALDLAASLATAALADAGRPAEDVRAVAAGIPGPIDVRTRVVRAPTILVDWVGIDPAAELAGRLGRPAVVGNDADMGAIGEYTFGAARGFADFLYIKASHGVGAGIVLGGRTYRGTTGIAGEIGHTQLPGATSWCRCGSRGCLETVASISEVREQLAHVLTTANEPTAAATLPPLPELVGNPAAARVITDAGRTIGRVVADLVNCLNPAAVVLGGELGAAGKPFVNGVRESIDRYAQPAAAQAVRTLPAELGARAELMGTVATAIRSLAGSVPAWTADPQVTCT